MLSRLRQVRYENSQRDLISKFNHYENVHEISTISFIDVEFSNLKKKSLCILSLAFVYILTGKKGCVSTRRKKNSNKKIDSAGSRLREPLDLIFLERFLLVNLPNIIDLEKGFSKSSLSNTGTFSFTVNDIYTFEELGDVLFKFRHLENLRVHLDFSRRNIKENIELLRSFGFFFKD